MLAMDCSRAMVAMKDYKSADRGSQMQRVYAFRSEILDMLDRRIVLEAIKTELGFDDMPRSTFGYHVRGIKAEAAKAHGSAQRRVTSNDEVTGKAFSPANKFPEDANPAQPETVPITAPDPVDEPRKPAKRKRRKKGVITPNLDAKDQNLDPSKWSSEL